MNETSGCSEGREGMGTALRSARPNGYASLIEVKQEDDVGKDTKVGIEFSSYRLLAIHSAHGGAATEYKI